MNHITAIYKSKDKINIENLNENIIINKDSYINELFIKKLNLESDKINHYSDYINELFMIYGLNGYIYENIFKEYNISKVVVSNKNLDDKVFLSKAIQNNISIDKMTLLIYRVTSILKLLLSIIVTLILSFFIPLYILVFYKNKNKKNLYNFSVIRTKATDEKISVLKNDFKINFFVDDISYKNTNYKSMYISSILNKMIALVKVPLITIKDIFSLYKESKQFFDVYFFAHLLYRYILRIPLKSTYEYYLNILMKQSSGSYITGNKEDRYAICEKRLAKKNNIKTICFPHGLEYSFKEPAGLVGDTFYCLSESSRKKLSSIYKENKFIYNVDIVTKMFYKECKIKLNFKRVVFFTEARDKQDIIINKQIIEEIIKDNIHVFLKLHPKDNISNYAEYKDKIAVISTINEAITNNICIARKSTILVEAFYNNSTSIAILINDLDKNILENYFPSLNDEKIIKFYNLDNLTDYILKNNSIYVN